MSLSFIFISKLLPTLLPKVFFISDNNSCIVDLGDDPTYSKLYTLGVTYNNKSILKLLLFNATCAIQGLLFYFVIVLYYKVSIFLRWTITFQDNIVISRSYQQNIRQISYLNTLLKTLNALNQLHICIFRPIYFYFKN